ncbi:hypothetical protein, partial [Nocardia wallacei]|uniref:hypothetical protein n=1 Tax=Nocardia wallacei TaxID=480035 RepID=UPI00245812F7
MSNSLAAARVSAGGVVDWWVDVIGSPAQEFDAGTEQVLQRRGRMHEKASAAAAADQQYPVADEQVDTASLAERNPEEAARGDVDRPVQELPDEQCIVGDVYMQACARGPAESSEEVMVEDPACFAHRADAVDDIAVGYTMRWGDGCGTVDQLVQRCLWGDECRDHRTSWRWLPNRGAEELMAGMVGESARNFRRSVGILPGPFVCLSGREHTARKTTKICGDFLARGG